MNAAEVLKMIDAGFSAAQIKQILDPDTPQPQPEPQPQPQPEPQPEPQPQPQPEAQPQPQPEPQPQPDTPPAWATALTASIENLTKVMQTYAVNNDQMPEAKSAVDSALASYLGGVTNGGK